MKKTKALKNAHTSNSKIGVGDYYGTGIRNPIGRMVDNYTDSPKSVQKKGKPPKSLA